MVLRRFTAGLVVVALFLLFGCSKEENYDEKVDSFIESLQAGDYEVFQELSHPSLELEVSPKDFESLSLTIQALGRLDDRTMEGTAVKDMQKQARYELEFEEGTVDLVIVVYEKNLVGYEFSGSAFDEAAASVSQQHQNSGRAPARY